MHVWSMGFPFEKRCRLWKGETDFFQLKVLYHAYAIGQFIQSSLYIAHSHKPRDIHWPRKIPVIWYNEYDVHHPKSQKKPFLIWGALISAAPPLTDRMALVARRSLFCLACIQAKPFGAFSRSGVLQWAKIIIWSPRSTSMSAKARTIWSKQIHILFD